MKLVYLYDGTPIMVTPNSDGEYIYPENEWTDISPPEGIYQPFYYDGNEWIGTSKDEWEKANIKPVVPNEEEKVIAELTMQQLQHQEEIESLQKDIALLTVQVLGGEVNA